MDKAGAKRKGSDQEKVADKWPFTGPLGLCNLTANSPAITVRKNTKDEGTQRTKQEGERNAESHCADRLGKLGSETSS